VQSVIERRKPIAFGSPQEGSRLFSVERLHLRRGDARRLDEATDVAGDKASDLGIAERTAEKPVHMPHGSRPETGAEHLRV
jgi:hypothetical protein